MEWTYAKRDGAQSLQDFFANKIAHEDDSQKFELIALSPVEQSVCYGAYRFTNKSTGQERVSALVIQLQSPQDGNTIAYRILTEYDGPTQHQCPKEIYDLLTPFRHCAEDSAHAKGWRHRVENWHRHGVTAPDRPDVIPITT